MTDEPTTLYRLYDRFDALLYVGIARNVTSRLAQHREMKEWWPDVARVSFADFPSRQAALTAEESAIKSGEPRYNVVHNPRGKNRSAVTTVPAAPLLKWICEQCHERVTRDGYLTMEWAELRRYEASTAQWDAEHQPEHGLVVLSGPDLFSQPRRVSWHVLHRDCDPNPESSSYWIGIECIRTLRELLDWTAHLLEKPWLTQTDWHSMLRKVST